jgi:hypothetical protein
LKTIEEAGVGALFHETTDALLAHGLPPSLKQNSTRTARGWESGCAVGYALAPRSSVVLSPSFPWSPSLHPSSPPPPPPPRASSVFASSFSDSATWWSGIALSEAALAKLQALASALQERNLSKAQAGARDYSVCLLYWYKITHTDARRQAGARDFFREFGTHALPGTGTLCSCFTSTQVRILTPDALRARPCALGRRRGSSGTLPATYMRASIQVTWHHMYRCT